MNILYSLDEGNLIITGNFTKTLAGTSYIEYQVQKKNKNGEFCKLFFTPVENRAISKLREVFLRDKDSKDIENIKFELAISRQKADRLVNVF